MPRQKMWVEWDDGAELTHSRKRPGHRSALTRDARGHLGQITMYDIGADEHDWSFDAALPRGRWWEPYVAAVINRLCEDLTERATAAIDVAAEKAELRWRCWWSERHRPTVPPANTSHALLAVNPMSFEELPALVSGELLAGRSTRVRQ